MRVLIGSVLLLVLAAGSAWLIRGESPGDAEKPPDLPGAGRIVETPEAADPALEGSASSPAAHAKAAACATGCAVGNHPITPLGELGYLGALERMATGSAAEKEAALETLLFHGLETRDLLADLGTGPLAPSDAALLRRELSRRHARLSVRVVDETGVVRAEIDHARFRVGIKEHVHATTERLQPPEVSGTVHRTGLHHLWTRL